jgi:hypothetical protein
MRGALENTQALILGRQVQAEGNPTQAIDMETNPVVFNKPFKAHEK